MKWQLQYSAHVNDLERDLGLGVGGLRSMIVQRRITTAVYTPVRAEQLNNGV